MNDPPEELRPPEPDAAPDSAPAPAHAPAPAPPKPNAALRDPEPPAAAPVKRVEAPPERRDFFGDAMRELLVPFSGIIGKKIAPLLAALEQIPDDAERLANSGFGLLDQPMFRPDQPGFRAPVNAPRAPERCLRPPGAVAGGTPSGFETACSRCGKCVEVCPVDAIRLDPNGLDGDGFPHIVADAQPCVVCNDLSCMKSCPTGALRLVDRLAIRMGTAIVNQAQCLRDHGENCTLCVDVCPIDGKADGSPGGTMAALFISPDTGKIRVRKSVCIGCGLCENRCPTEPRAIIVMPYVEPVDPIIA